MLVLLGCNHRSAPIAFRERLAFRDDEIGEALGDLLGRGAEEACILSTCNRVEIFARFPVDTLAAATKVGEFLCESRGVTRAELEACSYRRIGLDAVRHLFGVASGLDSMILGEPQILGQVRHAYHLARGNGALGPILERLLQQCLATAKRVRSETGISRNAVSVAFAAVGLARQIFGDLDGRSALVVGAGKMASLVVRHLVSHGIRELAVTSRRFDGASAFAREFGGKAFHWDEGLSRLAEVDVVVSCTGAPRVVLDTARVREAVARRRRRPLFIIDIAIPRDVDPEVNEIDNVYLYDVDALQSIVDSNLEERRRAAEDAREAIDQDVVGFDRWRQSLEITPTIVNLREHLLGIGRGEVERFRSRLGPLSADQRHEMEQLVRSLVQKILHRPVLHLKRSVDRGDVKGCTSAYREIFGLEEGAPTSRSDGGGARGTKRKTGPRRVLRGGKDG